MYNSLNFKIMNEQLCAFFFFFQAEDGIRDYKETGVQTCALPIFQAVRDGGLDFYFRTVQEVWTCPDTRSVCVSRTLRRRSTSKAISRRSRSLSQEIGRASCRERV